MEATLTVTKKTGETFKVDKLIFSPIGPLLVVDITERTKDMSFEEMQKFLKDNGAIV